MVAKFCTRSHGQPVLGVRSAAMISIRRLMSREGVIALSRCSGKALPDPGCGGDRGAARIGRGRQRSSLVRGAARLEQEPSAPLGLVDEGLEQARGCHVLMLVGEFVRL